MKIKVTISNALTIFNLLFLVIWINLLLIIEQAKSECDWLVMTSVFVASQSSCFFLCSREQIRQEENRLKPALKSLTSVFLRSLG